MTLAMAGQLGAEECATSQRPDVFGFGQDIADMHQQLERKLHDDGTKASSSQSMFTFLKRYTAGDRCTLFESGLLLNYLVFLHSIWYSS